MCHIRSWVEGFIPFTLTSCLLFYHSGLLFLDTEMVCNRLEVLKALLQQYFYPAFQYFWMMPHNYVSDRKGNIFLWYFPNLSQPSLTILPHTSLVCVKIDPQLLNSKIWLQVTVSIFLLTDYKLNCGAPSNGKN